MIETNVVQERIDQLTNERAGLVGNLQQLEAERVRIQHLISAYDGAIGELGRLQLLGSVGEEAAQE
jgi:hypothetical protein